MLGEAKAQFEAALRRLGKVKRPATGRTCAAGALITGGEVSEELVEDATINAAGAGGDIRPCGFVERGIYRPAHGLTSRLAPLGRVGETPVHTSSQSLDGETTASRQSSALLHQDVLANTDGTLNFVHQCCA
jgi:hypothetical protein